MKTWVGKKPISQDNEFGALLRSAEERKQLKKQKQKKKADMPQFFQAFVDNTTEPSIDYNFECGCFGSEHKVINNCLSCGRIICAREGERPCPYCGTPVFSNETLDDPEKYEAMQKEMMEKIGEQNWIPAKKRDLSLASQSEEIVTTMVDLDTDWFDNELNQIFIDEM
ncbi:Zinc finger motif, C2HC5-type family protein [Tritrichomonas foetus]|uniref:Zinc finger motif, C2HC5-type family protein n=1 Tax=Tritrichomonas foetus TaxID=1144522 RepID=A0A1J4JEF2_9EUKA|nr:Zinc finger motif, C2HC5-type family protein [Tritrichomonas foetus]|eukprot:OHS97488.1 Zinc finger motif, C2HC5-type family protein [Tritrichomonas foetus]